jgi:hypothetical protein
MNIRLVAVQQFPVKNKNLKNLLVFDGRFVPPSLLHIGQEEKEEKEKKEKKEKEKRNGNHLNDWITQKVFSHHHSENLHADLFYRIHFVFIQFNVTYHPST